MSTMTESDLKDLKNFINSRFDEIKAENAKILEQIKNLEAGQKQIETRLTAVKTRLEDWKYSIQKIPDLAEKIGELKNWRQIALVAITATVGGVIG